MNEKTKENILLGGIIVGVIAIIIAISSSILMLCWDYLMPAIFGLPEITFWQAVVMNILSNILFKQFYTYNKEK